MRRILFVLAIVMVTALTTTPPIAAEPLLRPSPAILDVRDEAAKIAEKASQMADWLLGNDSDKDPDESEIRATASQE
jgi:hypothetical protein